MFECIFITGKLRTRMLSLDKNGQEVQHRSMIQLLIARLERGQVHMCISPDNQELCP